MTRASVSLEKVTQTGVVITMTDDPQLDTSSNLDWVGEQWVGKQKKTKHRGPLIMRCQKPRYSFCSSRGTLLVFTLVRDGLWPVKGKKIGEENQSCIKLATIPVMLKRSEHIDIKVYFIRQKVENNIVELVYTPTNQLAADLLTKALPQVKVEQHWRMLMGSMQVLPPNSVKIWVRVLRTIIPSSLFTTRMCLFSYGALFGP